MRENCIGRKMTVLGIFVVQLQLNAIINIVPFFRVQVNPTKSDALIHLLPVLWGIRECGTTASNASSNSQEE